MASLSKIHMIEAQMGNKVLTKCGKTMSFRRGIHTVWYEEVTCPDCERAMDRNLDWSDV